MLFNSYEFIFLFLPLSFFIYFYLLEKRLITGCKPPQKPYRLKQNNSDKINQESSCERVSSQKDRLLVS